MPVKANRVRNIQYSNYGARRRPMGRRNRRKQVRGRRRGGRLTGAAIASWAAAGAYKYLFNTEDKYVDSTSTMTPSNVGTTLLLNGLTQGTDVSTRIGDSIRAVGLQMMLGITINNAATTTFIRLLLFWDNQCDGSAPGFSTNLLMSASYNALYNPDYSRRFRVIMDRTVDLDANSDQIQNVSRTFRLGRHVRFGLGNTGTIADIATGSLYFVAISDQATNTPTIAYSFRFMYIDN